MSKRNLVATVVGAHIGVLLIAAGIIGGCAREKKGVALATVSPVEEIIAPESVPESILEPEGLVEETELLVARKPESIPAMAEEYRPPVSREPEAILAMVEEEKVEVAVVEEWRKEPVAKPPIIPRLLPPSDRVTPSLERKTHKVVSGESLWKISLIHDTTVAELAAVNNLRPEAILRVGQVLVLPVETEPAATMKPAKKPLEEETVETGEGEFRLHTVQKGESLWTIANKYGVKVKEIVKINKIKDPSRIKAGRVLRMPR